MSRRFLNPANLSLDMQHAKQLAQACGGVWVTHRPEDRAVASFCFLNKVGARDFARRVHDSMDGRLRADVEENDPTNTVFIRTGR